MLKAAGAVLVVFSCGAFGYLKSAEMSGRLAQLMEIQKMVLLLLGEITYRREALPEALKRVSEKCREPLAGFLKEVSHTAGLYEGERFADIFSGKAALYLKDSALTSKDLEDFGRLGEYLGYMDVELQKNTVALYLEELKYTIEEITREMPVKKKLYQSMGVLGGIFLAIAFI